jgi:hypothetical protein
MVGASPFATLQHIMGGYVLARCLHVVTDLGVADVLEETPRTAGELAALVSAHPDALGRVLSFLSAYGVFEAQGDAFCHSPASRLLRSDHPQSMRAFVRMFGSRINWATYEMLEYTVRTGLPAHDKVAPGGRWAYLAEHPIEAEIFNAAMQSKARVQIAAILAAYDFSGFGVIGDIGGGLGHLLRSVLDATPTTKGVLFDLPHVIAQVNDMASDRLTLQAGDFFKDTLPTCDAYLLMDIIHDWGEKEAAAILKAIRQAAPSHAKLLLIESIIPDDPGPAWSKVIDIHMMTLHGGRQRTRQEYVALFDQVQFSFEREIDTGAGISIVEATPA